MTTDLWIAIAILALLIGLVLWGTRGHSKGGGGAGAGSDGGVRADVDTTTGGGGGDGGD